MFSIESLRGGEYRHEASELSSVSHPSPFASRLSQIVQLLASLDIANAPTPWDFLVISLVSSLWYLLNPFIYAWKNAAIREDVTVLWHSLGRKLTPVRFTEFAGSGSQSASATPPPSAASSSSSSSRVNGAFVY